MRIGKPKFLQLLIIITLALGTLVSMVHNPAKAQETNPTWSKQKRLNDHYFDSFAPRLIADKNKTVHAFHYTNLLEKEELSEEDIRSAIYYRQWQADSGWTAPIDIILPPTNAPSVSLQGVFLDRAGFFHLIYFAGGEARGNIYYSSAPAHLAGQASAWSNPIEIGEAAGPFQSAALVGDEDGNLIVVYAGKREGIGLYALHSEDAGSTWSRPELMYVEYQRGFFPLYIKLILDEQGNAHVVWSNYNSTNVSADEVFYAGMEVESKRWNEPALLAQRDEGDYEADWPSIVAYDDELIVLYMDGRPATRWMRRSQDGGETWSEPINPFLLVGENGAAVFLIDSNDNLHAIMGNRLSEYGAINQGMWHSVWQGDSWSPVRAIVSGPQTPDFDPTQPEAVISQGNMILATWTKDTTSGPRNGAWYSYTSLGTPELQVAPLPVPETNPDPVPTTTFLLEPDSSDTLQDRAQEDSVQEEGAASLPPSRQGPIGSIIPSLVLVLLLIVVILLPRFLTIMR